MLKDKIAIISGAASGIGLEIAQVFLNEGAKVVFTDINQDALNRTVESFKSNGFDCIGVTADVSNEKECLSGSLCVSEAHAKDESLLFLI